MLDKFFQNTCKPEGLGGKLMVAMMNTGHSKMAEWGLSFFKKDASAEVLDIGCGGGANVERLLRLCPDGKVTGIDYSEVSVEAARRINASAIAAGRCEVFQQNVMNMAFTAGSFDAVTAFETIYFWPYMQACFTKVFEILRPGGVFLICNESDGENKADDKWTKMIDGMRIYGKEELEKLLLANGYKRVNVHHDQNRHWLCIVAEK